MAFDKQKIFNYLDGKLTTFEIKQVEAWCRDPANEELFYGWLDEWERSHLLYAPEEARLLVKRQDIFADPVTTADTVNHGSRLNVFFEKKRMWRVAVSVAVIVMSGFFLPYEGIMNREFVTEEGETRTLLLPDGSQVTLNTNTVLKVPRFGFGSRTREVALYGEALFSVVSTGDRREFIVKTHNSADIVVLGTEFSVFSRTDSTHVKLNHGKVLFRYRGIDSRLSELDMRPGEQVALGASGEVVVNDIEEDNTVPEWAIQEFRFDRTTLNEIVQLLYNRYRIEVKLQSREMAGLSLSGTYEVHRGEELLEIVAEVLGLGILQEKNKYVLIFKSNI